MKTKINQNGKWERRSTPPPRARALPLPARRLGIARAAPGIHFLSGDGLGRLVLLGVDASGRVPVVHHLDSKEGVEGEAGDEAVEDEGVVDFGEGGVDAGEGAEEVVHDL